VTEEFFREADSDRRRKARLAEMKRIKARQIRQRKLLKILVPAVLVLVLAVGIGNSAFGRKATKEQQAKQGEEAEQITESGIATGDNESTATSTTMSNTALSDTVTSAIDTGNLAAKENAKHIYYATENADTKAMNGEVYSNYGIFIDRDSNVVLAERNSTTRINPASMTKILTVLVAAEQLESAGKLTALDDTFTMTLEITDYGFVNDCSNVGFLDGEVITVRDLLYGTILPSGADAAVGLATYVSGSHEAFVELMNDKLQKLGLSETTHVTNCVGLYDEEHYSTVYDMAMIMEAAMDNELCRQVMGERTYTTSQTEQHPEGITISNWFIRRIEDKDTGGKVLCAKTGYVVQSGSCAASYGKDNNGKEYICVTADAHSSWRCIYDHVALYSQFSEAKEES